MICKIAASSIHLQLHNAASHAPAGVAGLEAGLATSIPEVVLLFVEHQRPPRYVLSGAQFNLINWAHFHFDPICPTQYLLSGQFYQITDQQLLYKGNFCLISDFTLYLVTS